MTNPVTSNGERRVDKPAWCRAGYHCWKVNFRMITCAVWRCEWCGKTKVGASQPASKWMGKR